MKITNNGFEMEEEKHSIIGLHNSFLAYMELLVASWKAWQMDISKKATKIKVNCSVMAQRLMMCVLTQKWKMFTSFVICAS